MAEEDLRPAKIQVTNLLMERPLAGNLDGALAQTWAYPRKRVLALTRCAHRRWFPGAASAAKDKGACRSQRQAPSRTRRIALSAEGSLTGDDAVPETTDLGERGVAVGGSLANGWSCRIEGVLEVSRSWGLRLWPGSPRGLSH